MYWVYQKHIFTWRNKPVQAKLMEPSSDQLAKLYQKGSFRDPRVTQPSIHSIEFSYQIDPRHPKPDLYFESFGLFLVSERLANLFKAFDVRAEYFPVTMVGPKGKVQIDLKYFVFHSLEGVLPAMEEEQSQWTGNYDIGIPRLILDLSKFEHRPLFLCDHLYLPLMRNDLKQSIQKNGITGFEFLDPRDFHSGQFGVSMDFDV